MATDGVSDLHDNCFRLYGLLMLLEVEEEGRLGQVGDGHFVLAQTGDWGGPGELLVGDHSPLPLFPVGLGGELAVGAQQLLQGDFVLGWVEVEP